MAAENRVAIGDPELPTVEIGQGGEKIVEGTPEGQMSAVEMGSEFPHEFQNPCLRLQATAPAACGP